MLFISNLLIKYQVKKLKSQDNLKHTHYKLLSIEDIKLLISFLFFDAERKDPAELVKQRRDERSPDCRHKRSITSSD